MECSYLIDAGLSRFILLLPVTQVYGNADVAFLIFEHVGTHLLFMIIMSCDEKEMIHPDKVKWLGNSWCVSLWYNCHFVALVFCYLMDSRIQRADGLQLISECVSSTGSRSSFPYDNAVQSTPSMSSKNAAQTSGRAACRLFALTHVVSLFLENSSGTRESRGLCLLPSDTHFHALM